MYYKIEKEGNLLKSNLIEEEKVRGKSVYDIVCYTRFVLRISYENVNAALFRLLFVMRNNPISHYWLTRLLYRVQYCTISTIS